ncbi:hypothetical protein [Paramagnetospirillum kuznetsovii]|nr:hypothetical protein [Paramagnetospirillum kuznetsovii]
MALLTLELGLIQFRLSGLTFEEPIPSDRVRPYRGKAAVITLVPRGKMLLGWAPFGDFDGAPTRSSLTMTVGGVTLPTPHATIDDIVDLGGGRYRHDRNWDVIFSMPPGRLDGTAIVLRYTLYPGATVLVFPIAVGVVAGCLAGGWRRRRMIAIGLRALEQGLIRFCRLAELWWQNWSGAAALVLASLAIAVAVGEVGARWFEPRINTTIDSIRYQGHPGWQSFPPYHAMIFTNEDMVTIPIRSDELGMRNPPGSFALSDVVVLGDSFIAGDNTAEDLTFVNQLRRYGIKAYNAGMDGSGTIQQLNFIAHAIDGARALKLLVVMVYLGNDLRDNYFGGTVPPEVNGAYASALSAPESPAELCDVLASCRWLWRGGARSILSRQAWDSLANYTVAEMAFLRRVPDPAAAQAIINTRMALASIRDLAASRGVKVLVVAIPSKAQTLGSFREISGFAIDSRHQNYARDLGRAGFSWDQPNAIVQAISAELGLPFRSLLEPFRREAMAGLYYDFDVHWSARGQELAASITAPAIQDMLARR